MASGLIYKHQKQGMPFSALPAYSFLFSFLFSMTELSLSAALFLCIGEVHSCCSSAVDKIVSLHVFFLADHVAVSFGLFIDWITFAELLPDQSGNLFCAPVSFLFSDSITNIVLLCSRP